MVLSKRSYLIEAPFVLSLPDHYNALVIGPSKSSYRVVRDKPRAQEL